MKEKRILVRLTPGRMFKFDNKHYRKKELKHHWCLYDQIQEAENISEDVFTSLLKRYIMTKDQLEENGYPVW